MKKACVVIPIYQLTRSPYEEISLQQCLKVLGGHDLYFACPEHLSAPLSRQAEVAEGRIRIKTFKDHFFKDISGYNRLMKYPGFYKAFAGYEYLLIHQLDAFVFRDELLFWCDRAYDHIGAPLFEGHEKAGADSPLVGQGNGGFCLRNRNSCLQVLNSFRKLKYQRSFADDHLPGIPVRIYRYLRHQLMHAYTRYPLQPIINEDLFWSEVIPANFSAFRVPSAEEAIPFSFEVNPELLYERNGSRLPFGCHAWWRYNFDFWKPQIRSYGYDL